MQITTQYVDGQEFMVLDEDPGLREEYEKRTGNKFPKTRTYRSTIDGHLQSWWLATESSRKFIKLLSSGQISWK